jgi:hypothetical protein
VSGRAAAHWAVPNTVSAQPEKQDIGSCLGRCWGTILGVPKDKESMTIAPEPNK